MTTKDLEQVTSVNAIANHRGSDLDAASVYETLINQALTNPGAINKCYSLFHDYSFSNTLLAYFQMEAKGLDVTPIGTFKKWQSLGKHVAKGSKALAILYPVFGSFFTDDEVENKDGTITKKRVRVTYIKGFQVHHEHFALSQCKEYGQETEQLIDVKVEWDRVLKDLNIEQIKWGMMEGNAQGYAIPTKRQLAINPLCQTKAKTMVHEIAHILLHGKDEEFIDNDVLERNIKEVQAEMVAYLVMATLKVEDDILKFSRGYIQAWLKDSKLETSETRAIMRAADKILSAIANKPKKEHKKSGK